MEHFLNRMRELAGVQQLNEQFRHGMTGEHMMDIDKAIGKAVDVLMSNEGMDEINARGHVIDHVEKLLRELRAE